MDPLVFLVIPFPDIDPIAIQIGPLAIRWYALAYLAGFLLGWRYIHLMNRRPPVAMSKTAIDDLLVWIMVGVILGGRLGQVLFYHPGYYFQNPLEIFAIWQGGMAFHGGFAGVIVAIFLFARRRGIRFLVIGDLITASVPIGLFLGRIANFINGELWGRPTDVAWAMIFPRADDQPRHPSQLYEAALEGLALLILTAVLVYLFRARERPGIVSGAFMIGYAIARSASEFVREPDALVELGFVTLTMGQTLSVPMVLYGAWLLWYASRQPRFEGHPPEPAADPKPAK